MRVIDYFPKEVDYGAEMEIEDTTQCSDAGLKLDLLITHFWPLTRVDSADWTKDLVAFLVWSGAGPETLAGVARSAERVVLSASQEPKRYRRVRIWRRKWSLLRTLTLIRL